jgi:hypothetical protein
MVTLLAVTQAEFAQVKNTGGAIKKMRTGLIGVVFIV